MGNRNCFDPHKSYFIIDSTNLDSVHTKLYGYCIVNGDVIEDAEYIGERSLTGEGVYVYVKKDSGSIVICQDFVGSYGLYLFRDKDYFALSNSFILLEDYVKRNHKITLNKSYADSLIVMSLCSVSFSHTLVNEITMLDRAAVVYIDIDNRELSIRNCDYQENTIELDSVEGITTLDSWYNKWTGIMSNIISRTKNVEFDLSGGFDSRMVFALGVRARGVAGICIHTFEDELHTHKEDYEIASEIASYYGLSLNDESEMKRELYNFSEEDILNIAFYGKLGFHKQMYGKFSKYKTPVYCFPGHGGECVRAYWDISEDEYIAKWMSGAKKYTTDAVDMTKSVRHELKTSFREIKEKFASFGREIKQEDMTLNLYRETRCRNHFGKGMVEDYFAGNVTFCPLLDPGLHKLKLSSDKCRDKNLLMAVIFERYGQELLNFRFEGNRSIGKDVLQCAREINEIYPYREMMNSYSGKNCDAYTKRALMEEVCQEFENKKIPAPQIDTVVKGTFYSQGIKNTFDKIYDERVYNMLAEKIETENYFPLQSAIAAIAISKIEQDVSACECMSYNEVSDFVQGQLRYKLQGENSERLLRNNECIDNYITARIDIKNRHQDGNDLEFMEISDKAVIMNTPKWFDKEGKGYSIESMKGRLKLVVKCINAGILEIALRGKDVRDVNKERIPVWIDYKAMWINEEKIFDGVQYACHDNAFRASRKVEDGDVVSIIVEWGPHDERLHRLIV